jgi:hypothetical protein
LNDPYILESNAKYVSGSSTGPLRVISAEMNGFGYGRAGTSEKE